MDFESRVAKQADIFFDQMLPRLIDATFHGRGYALVATMLDLHDRRAIDQALSLPKPSNKAIRRAQAIRGKCPPVAVVTTHPWEGFLLGKYERRSEVISGELFSSYREISTDWRVSIFLSGFIASGWPEEQWDDEILLTIFHEYIHYLESFLPRREQPLRGREQGQRDLQTYTIAQARKKDRRFRMKRTSVLAATLIGAVVAVWALAGLPIPSTEDDRTIAQLVRVHDELNQEHSRLVRLSNDKGVKQRLEQTRAEYRKLAEKDVAYDHQKALKLLKQMVPGCSVLDLDQRLMVQCSRKDSDLYSLLGKLKQKMPGARLGITAAYGSGWSAYVKLRQASVVPKDREPERCNLKPPTFQSAQGRKLRQAIPRLRQKIAQLRKTLGAVRHLDAWRAALKRDQASQVAATNPGPLFDLIEGLRTQVKPRLDNIEIVRCEGAACVLKAQPKFGTEAPPSAVIDLEQIAARKRPEMLAVGRQWVLSDVRNTRGGYLVGMIWGPGAVKTPSRTN